MGVEFGFEAVELVHVGFADGAGEVLGAEGGVFGEVEAAAGIEDEVVHLVAEPPEAFAVLGGDFEVEGEGVAVDGVGEEEIVGFVAFEDAEEGFKLGFLLHLDLAGKDAFGVFFGDEGLVLDEAPGEIGFAPVGDVVEEEGESDEALGMGFAVSEDFSGGVFGGVEETHSGAVAEELEEPPHDGLGDEAHDGVGEVLVFGEEGGGAGGPFFEIPGGVEIAPSGVFAPGEAVDPADHVVGIVVEGFEGFELGVPVWDGKGEDADVAASNLFHFDADAGDDSEESGGGDDFAEEGVFLVEGADVAVGEDDVEFGDVFAQGAGVEVVFAVDVHAEGTGEGGVHGSADDGWPVAVFDPGAPEFFDGDAGLAVDFTGWFVEPEDLVHAGDVEDDALGTDGGVSVGASGAPEDDLTTGFAGELEDVFDFGRRGRAENVAIGGDGLAVAFDPGHSGVFDHRFGGG